MANNPYVNKVEYGGRTLIDLTNDTATAADVAEGKTFHDKSGALVIGAAAGGGVISFNGRGGAVMPANGDYTAAMVGARPNTWTPSASDVGAIPTSQKGAPGGVAAQDEICAVESADTAAAAHTVGEYISWNGLFYQVTAEIAVGDAITPGTNCTATTVAEVLAALQGEKLDVPENAGTVGQVLTRTATGSAWADASGGLLPQIIVTTRAGASVTATLDGTTVGPVTADEDGIAALGVTDYGTWTVAAELGEKFDSVELDVNTVKIYDVTIILGANIYGVQWDGTSTTLLSRTDASANFADPVPYVAGAATYGSPFDELSPWKDMVRVTDAEAGEMVKIPKFWYKLTQSGKTISIQIADRAVDGFSVCPACMNLTGFGERDYVLVGRYHCAASTCKSTTGVKPQVSLTQEEFRGIIQNLGSNVYMMDFAMRFTIWLLYIVEFANWNSQATIGKGCGNNSAVENMGYTDSMPYHTGTMLSSRDTYGVGTQYRYLEGLWDNCYDFIEGCHNSSSGLMVVGVSVGTPASGWIAGLTVSTSGPFPCFINSSADGGGENAYVCDYWSFNASYPAIFVGGYYSQNGGGGMFCVYCTSPANASGNLGSRLRKSP